MFEELLKQWANEQGFQTWSQDHAAVLRNLAKWLEKTAVPPLLVLDRNRCPHKNITGYEFGHYCTDCGMMNP